MVTSERPIAEKKIQFLEPFDPNMIPNKKIKPNEKIEVPADVPKETVQPSEELKDVTGSDVKPSSLNVQNDSIKVSVEEKEDPKGSNDRVSQLEQELGQMKDILQEFLKLKQDKATKEMISPEKRTSRKKKV